MAINVTVGANSYDVPVQGERSWGTEVTNLLVDLAAQSNKIANNSFTLSGSNFVVTDATGSFGVKANYFEGNATVAGVGGVRLANPADETPTVATAHTSVAWRNSTNTGDLLLKPSSDTVMEFAGIELVNLTAAQAMTNKTLTSPVLNDTISGTSIKDEDDMVSDSDQHLATQQSIKAYVDSVAAGIDTFAELTDTTITTPVDGNFPIYDATAVKWVNKLISGDLTVDKDGVATIANNAISNDNVDAAANIAWTKLDKTGSNLTDLGTKSHTDLSDIGTNTHAQLDTAVTDSTNHIANTSNPHSVTATQVGLGNVDNTADATKNAAVADLTNKTIWFDDNSLRRRGVPTSTSATLSSSDDIVLVSGNTTMTLPDPGANNGQQWVIKKVDTVGTTVTVDASPSTLDGSSTYSITQQYASITVFSNGAEWHII